MCDVFGTTGEKTHDESSSVLSRELECGTLVKTLGIQGLFGLFRTLTSKGHGRHPRGFKHLAPSASTSKSVRLKGFSQSTSFLRGSPNRAENRTAPILPFMFAVPHEASDARRHRPLPTVEERAQARPNRRCSRQATTAPSLFARCSCWS